MPNGACDAAPSRTFERHTLIAQDERVERARPRPELLEQKQKTRDGKRRARRLVLGVTIVEEVMAKYEELARSRWQRAAQKLTRKIDREACLSPMVQQLARSTSSTASS